MEFRLPELGEGIETATVVNVLVAEGATVSAGQDVAEVETDKASMPIQVPMAGVIGKVLVQPGDKIKVGAPLMLVLEAGAAPPPSTAARSRTSEKSTATVGSTAKTPAAELPRSLPETASAPATGETTEFRLPELGEGIEMATVVNVLVAEGVTVSAGQDVAEVETDKASMPIQVPMAGVIGKVLVQPGDKIKVGAPLMLVSPSGGTAPSAAGATPSARRVEEPLSPIPSSERPSLATDRRAPMSANGDGSRDTSPVPAGPATRRLARELGVDLRQVRGSARGGRVTIDDVKAFVRDRIQQPAPVAVGSVSVPPLPDFSKWGPIERQAVSGVRKKTAENMALAWHVCAMVTQFDQADITDLEAGRKRIVDSLPKDRAKVTMTVLALKAVVAALKEFPQFNASFDMTAGEVILKRYYHIGVAVDTPHGLFVPVLRDVDRKGIQELASELTQKADLARAKKLPLDDMRGGTFTITNLGGISGTAFTPIVNYPEVAILGLSRSSVQPVWRGDKFEPRLILPLSLTYDHRLIDGADGARFTAFLVKVLSDPMRLLIEG